MVQIGALGALCLAFNYALSRKLQYKFFNDLFYLIPMSTSHHVILKKLLMIKVAWGSEDQTGGDIRAVRSLRDTLVVVECSHFGY